MTSFPSGCLGKLPLHGDFIRFNAASREVQDLDRWIQEGIYQGYKELGSRWDSTFDAAPTSRFIFQHPHTGRVVAGLFKPSVDKAGRRYPFLVYTLIEPGGLGNDAGYLPLAMDGFLRRAAEMVDWSDSAINLNAFLSGFQDLQFEADTGDPGAGLPGARKSFAKYVLSHGAGDYWKASFGAPDDERRFAAIQLACWGADIRAPESAALILPLTEPSAEAAFWVELCRRFSGDNRIPTLTMWNRPAGDTPALLHMAFGALTSRCFLPFVLPGRESGDISDLSRPGNVDSGPGGWAPQLVDRARATFGEVLGEESLKLADLLQRLPRAKGI